MIEYHRYRDHEIAIQLCAMSPGQFRWVWRIDGLHTSKSRNVLLAEEVARSEALMYAQLMIAKLEHALAIEAG